MMVARVIACRIESCGECKYYDGFRHECEAPKLSLPKRVKDAKQIPWWCPLPMAKVVPDGPS